MCRRWWKRFRGLGSHPKIYFVEFEIIFAGRRTDQQMLVDRLRDLRISVHCYDYLPHHQSIALALSVGELRYCCCWRMKLC